LTREGARGKVGIVDRWISEYSERREVCVETASAQGAVDDPGCPFEKI
jgi:hypothetical protein